MSVSTQNWSRFVPNAGSIAGVLLVLVLWELVATQFNPREFPGLVLLVESFWEVLTNQTQYDTWDHISISLTRIVLGFLIVMGLGTVSGIMMGRSNLAEDYFSAPITAALTIPSVIWAFLGVLWFGLTELLVPVFVIVVILLPYVTVNMWQGTKALDQGLLEMGQAFKANRRQMWRHVYIPQLTPFLFATGRFSFAIAWKISLVAEIFGTNSGVGLVANNYYLQFHTTMVIAWALPIMILTFLIERVLQHLEKRAYRWRPTTEEAADIEVVE